MVHSCAWQCSSSHHTKQRKKTMSIPSFVDHELTHIYRQLYLSNRQSVYGQAAWFTSCVCGMPHTHAIVASFSKQITFTNTNIYKSSTLTHA